MCKANAQFKQKSAKSQITLRMQAAWDYMHIMQTVSVSICRIVKGGELTINTKGCRINANVGALTQKAS